MLIQDMLYQPGSSNDWTTMQAPPPGPPPSIFINIKSGIRITATHGKRGNAKKVISKVYASFELQCTVSGRWSKHKTDVTAWHGIHLSHKKSMKYSGHRKLLCALSKLSNLMLLTSSDTKRTLMHLSLFTNSAQRELVSICTHEYTRPQ